MPGDIYQRLGTTDENENMVSNLPLLFAGGYPTPLEKITESQLEKFIPFMVQCSLGDIQSPVLDSSCEPEWWPEDVPFTIPLRKPTNCNDGWLDKLKEIVAICYQFHKSVFLLRFCENLSAYQPESLRFINNYNSTTSLFDRVSKKLLVTFRNENMLYDQPRVNNKKTLMPKMQNSQSVEPHQMVEPSLFDIYLCDSCDAELYSSDEYLKHEKRCPGDNVAFDSDDDDVILVEGEKDDGEDEDEEMEEPALDPEVEAAQHRNSFLQHFELCKSAPTPNEDKKPLKLLTPHKRMSQTALGSNNNNTIFGNKNTCAKSETEKKNARVRRVPRGAPGVRAFLKDQPITSPAGQRLISQSNAPLTDEYIRERIERYERFCAAPPLAPDASNRPKFMDKKPITYNITTFRSNTKHYHYYKFPRRQFSTKRRNDHVNQLERMQIQQTNCKPVRITVQRLSNKEIETLKTQVKVETLKSQVKRRKPNREHKKDTESMEDVIIDLCTTDAESDDDSTTFSHGMSATSSTSTVNYGRRSNTIQPTHNTLLFVDCSVPEDHLLNGVETVMDPRLQLTTARSQYDSTANLLVKNEQKQPSKLSHRKSRVYSQIQQDKENRIFSYLSEQSQNTQTAAYLYAEDDLDMDANIVPTSLSTNNLISIDLTL